MNRKFNEHIFSHFPIMESKRLTFRQFNKKDADSFFLIRSNPEVMKFMDIITMKSKHDAENLIKSYIHEFKNSKGITWAIVEKSNNQLIGSFSYWRLIKNHCRAEIGFSLHPDFHRKGYMTETFQTLIPFGFEKMKLHSMEACVSPENLASTRLLEKTGFTKEAQYRENFFNNNAFTDTHVYCLLESDERTW